MTRSSTSSARSRDGAAPIAGRVRPPSLVHLQRLVDIPTRWTLLGLGLWVVWRTRDTSLLGAWPVIIGAYALLAVLTTAFWFGRPEDRPASRLEARVAYGSYAADALFVAALIWRDGGLASPLYILLVLLALKAVGLAPVLPGMIWLPFAFGPLYAVALWLASGNFAFLADNSFVSRYVLLWAWLVGVMLLAWELTRRVEQAVSLDAALVQQQVALAQKTEVLQRTATDLGDRVLELRSLQEVAKALATTLRTEETLQLVAETLWDITGSSHCAVGLVDPGAHEGQLSGTVVSDELVAPLSFEMPLAMEPATAEASRSGRMVHTDPGAEPGSPLHQLLGGHACAVTPLISRGQPIGALYVAEHPSSLSGRAAGNKLNVTEQLLTSFAYFAATTIENARLYQDAWEKRRELEAVLAGIGDGVVVADPELSLILMNPVARDILGLEVEPPAGVPLGPYLAAPAPVVALPQALAGAAPALGTTKGQGLADLLLETLRGDKELIRELDLPGPGLPGETGHDAHARTAYTRTYGALASPVLDADGTVRGVVAVLRDITAQKELERMKSNFLSVVSHELRTPLHSIKGFVEIILMGKTGPVTELQEDFLKTVRTQTTSLQRMIDDLLEFSRMEAGRVRLHLTEVSVPLLIESVAARLAPLAEEGGLQLYLDLPRDLPEIDADRSRLEQVLTNLVENAIKFTPSGGRITVSGASLGDRVRLTVADTGIGIPPDEQERVFDRFYQVDGSERRAYRGTGLGLSICKHIVERHNGRIWAESDGLPGHGSRFQVELPVVLRPAEAPTIDFTTPAAAPVRR